MAGSCEKKILKIKPELNWQDLTSRYIADMKGTTKPKPTI